ncbi:MAG: hypothetical protein H7138_19555, partial [Myxococcales bacterium]|nr:hypothetical protein [Myxococcales bacterium]
VADPWATPPAAVVADPWAAPPTAITPVLERSSDPDAELRPSGWAVAIGVGYTFPTSLQTPNITSVRLRLASGLTIEPQLALAASSIRMPVGANDQGQLTVGSLVRYPLRARRRVDLEAIASAAVSYHTVDPAGDLNNRATTTFDLGYGLALAYWLTAHWSVSLTATNPLLSIDRTRQEAGASGTSVNQSTTGGLVFDPQVAVMIHLYD